MLAVFFSPNRRAADALSQYRQVTGCCRKMSRSASPALRQAAAASASRQKVKAQVNLSLLHHRSAGCWRTTATLSDDGTTPIRSRSFTEKHAGDFADSATCAVASFLTSSFSNSNTMSMTHRGENANSETHLIKYIRGGLAFTNNDRPLNRWA